MKKIYLCIDLKTFYASVECNERHLDPFQTNLVVADPSRGKGALCLAITPKMKSLGISNRCRLYEIPKTINYLMAVPRMQLYMQYAANIYEIYLRYVSKDDIHVYSIDEAFLYISPYLDYYQMSVKELAQTILDDIFEQTHITATVGIGTNLYLAKIAMDIIAKHSQDNLGYLDEQSYQEKLWHHRPLTDFWHIGVGIASRLSRKGIYDMYDISHRDEKSLYKEFGINAKYLIDHAWGKEPTTINEIKAYHSRQNSISHSQVLFEDYDYSHALLVVKEMVETKVLDLVRCHLVSDRIFLSIRYSHDCHQRTGGSLTLHAHSHSLSFLLPEFVKLYKKTTHPDYPIRQIAISFGNVIDEAYTSYTLFTDIQELEEEDCLQESIIKIKQKYGKNAVLKGMNYLEKATTRKRNTLIGGHNAT